MGTTIYEVPLSEVQDKYKDDIIISYLLETRGFNAFDLERYCEGSIVNGDNLYLLDTDYNPVRVFGVEVDDVELLLEDYTVDELDAAGFIKPATKEVIRRYLSDYELTTDFDLDEVASALMSEGHTFTEIVKAANNIDLLDAYLG
ncbi:MAG: hypothetical protein IJE78_06210 [Bacteroidaceae bacterium]|nr:hypothetical protein [Bacteroidaceae bacterium]